MKIETEDLNVMMALDENLRDTKVITVHSERNMNVQTKFHGIQ